MNPLRVNEYGQPIGPPLAHWSATRRHSHLSGVSPEDFEAEFRHRKSRLH